jgi:DNA invertase Pin-like site-specific DNA recombinase
MNMRPTRAILLVRISDDKAGDAGGVGRQEVDGRSLADRLGWTIAEVIVENDVSAYKRRRIRLPDGTTALRTVRPGFRSVLDKLASGERDGLLAYDLDRTARDPRDLEDLIDVVESKNPRIPVESVTGSLRLANDADVSMARIMVAIANKSSRDTARRVARKHEQLAAEGKPGGGGFRGYGFTAEGHAVVEDEAEILREIGARILGDWDGWTDEQRASIDPEVGESLHSIAADLEARGVPAATRVPWSGRSVGSVVSKASVAGLRSHKGEIVGPAIWEAIIDRERWEAIGLRLAQRAGTTDLSLQRWLNGVLRCSLCGHLLSGSHGNGGPRYWCDRKGGGCGKIAVKASFVEDEVERQVLDLLARPKILYRLQRLATTEVSDQARQELAQDEEQLKELARMWAKREITFAEYTEARGIIEKRVKESRALVVSTTPRILRGLLSGDVQAGWERLTPADKREVILALIPGYDVLPHDRSHGNKFRPERLVPIKP